MIRVGRFSAEGISGVLIACVLTGGVVFSCSEVETDEKTQ